MNIRRDAFLLFALFTTVMGCRTDHHTSTKIIDDYPVNVAADVIPAHAVQQMMILKSLSLQVLIPIINRTATLNPIYPELTPGPSSSYSFKIHDSKAGDATYSFQFFDSGNNLIDPIALQTSTSTVQSVHMTASGASALFPVYSETMVMTFDTSGLFSSPLRSVGTISQNGSGYNVNFQYSSPGADTTALGFRSGLVIGSGTGPTSPVSMTLNISAGHQIDGSISWEGQTGQIHIEQGTGFVISNHTRIPIN